jgi:hypothetical protein
MTQGEQLVQVGDADTEDLWALVQEAIARQFVLWVADGRLKYRGPAGMLPAGLRERLALNRTRLIEALQPPRFRSYGAPTIVPIPKHHRDYWREIRAGAFDVGFINGTKFVLKLAQPFDRAILESRLRNLIDRHRILGSRVSEGARSAQFDYLGADSVALRVVHLTAQRSSSNDDLDAVARPTVTNLVWERFDAAAGPLLRVFAVVQSPTQYILGVVAHHFVCDAFSLNIIFKELILGAAGDPCPLQYADYVLAMNEWLSSLGARMRLEYWKSNLRDAPATRVPPDLECTSDEQADLHVTRFSLEPDVVNGLLRLASANTATLFQVVLAAKIAVLSWFSGSSDVVLLIQHSGRNDSTLLNLVGATTDRLPIRTRVTQDMRFCDLLLLVNETLLNAYRYELHNSVLESAAVGGSALSVIPAVNFIDLASGPLQVGARSDAVSFKFESPKRQGSPQKYASHWMNIVRVGSVVHGDVGYSPLLYRMQTMDRFLQTFSRLLSIVAVDSGMKLSKAREIAEAGRVNHSETPG